MVTDELVELVQLIDEMRADEGDWLTINASNGGFDGPNDVVEFGTMFDLPATASRVAGDSLLDCLRKAVEIKRRQRI